MSDDMTKEACKRSYGGVRVYKVTIEDLGSFVTDSMDLAIGAIGEAEPLVTWSINSYLMDISDYQDLPEFQGW